MTGATVALLGRNELVFIKQMLRPACPSINRLARDHRQMVERAEADVVDTRPSRDTSC
jgi:hypothetical protein